MSKKKYQKLFDEVKDDEWKLGFWCWYCGKKFGMDPQKLALHKAKNCIVLKDVSQ